MNEWFGSSPSFLASLNEPREGCCAFLHKRLQQKKSLLRPIKNNIKIHNQGSVAWPLENDKLACVALAKRPFYTFILPLERTPFRCGGAAKGPPHRGLGGDGTFFRWRCYHYACLSLLPGSHSVVWVTFNSAACLLYTSISVKWVWRGSMLHLPSPARAPN